MHETERQVPSSERWRAFFMYGNLPLGLIAVGFLLGTYALLGLPPSVPLLVLAFCGTFLVYQVERAAGQAPEDAFNHPARLAWMARHRRYVRGSSALALIASAATLPLLQPATLTLGTALAVVSVLYAAPLLPRQRRLKAIWFLKPLSISTAWAVGGVVLPVLEAGAPLTPAVLLLCGYRFFFVLPNTLLADWPDRRGDVRAGLTTVATRLSERSLRRLATASLLGCLIGGTAALLFFDPRPLLLVDLAGPVLMLATIRGPLPRTRWFYHVTLDAIVAWPAVTAVAAWLSG